MDRFSLPFPDKELAYKELTYDPCYLKIPEQDRIPVVDAAWRKGEQAAIKTFKEFNGNYNFTDIAQKSGLAIEKKNIDYVVGNQRYFSDYISGKKLLILYLGSIALWAENNSLSLYNAINIIISHEYFHFLECTSLGLTSRDYTVPMLCIGKIKLGKTGIRALSEIGAHAFAHTYYNLVAKKEVI
ncbi:MAG TPA: hypothetical protein GXX36_10115 [Clostridiaceae bacterium]|nr:hypothetical protein [Clostridiaceae bacterium]